MPTPSSLLPPHAAPAQGITASAAPRMPRPTAVALRGVRLGIRPTARHVHLQALPAAQGQPKLAARAAMAGNAVLYIGAAVVSRRLLVLWRCARALGASRVLWRSAMATTGCFLVPRYAGPPR